MPMRSDKPQVENLARDRIHRFVCLLIKMDKKQNMQTVYSKYKLLLVVLRVFFYVCFLCHGAINTYLSTLFACFFL